MQKALSNGFSKCRTNSFCVKINNQKDGDARDAISNSKVDEKSDDHEGPDKNSETNEHTETIAKKSDDNEKKCENELEPEPEPEPDEIKTFVQENDVDVATDKNVKKIGKHTTVYNIIVPGE